VSRKRRRPAPRPFLEVEAGRAPRHRRLRETVLAVLALAGLLVALVGGAVLFSVVRADEEPTIPPGLLVGDPGPVHVHGLGIDPVDGSLFIATHSGTWRVADGENRAERVGDSHQDTMGFTVVGPRHFLGSGHPDLNEAREKGLPPHLGLIESNDAGKTWRPVSLLGAADFHILRTSGTRIYGYDASGDRRTEGGRGAFDPRRDARRQAVSSTGMPSGSPARRGAALTMGL
jgi:hypothetical protein